ncbi:MAG: hypothetical protein ACYTGQ_18730, partial [Planctomycetota bacterium]
MRFTTIIALVFLTLPAYSQKPTPINLQPKEQALLPAASAKLHHGLVLQKGAPSFITRWTRDEQHAAFQIKLAQAGTYQFAFRYRCPPEQTG